eukprot:7479734-Pyramimonas_sp.AAC.1
MSQQWLRMVLVRFNISQGYLNAIQALGMEAVGYLKVGSERHRLFEISRGVPQGCPLSGTLWALGMDPMCRHLAAACERGSQILEPVPWPAGSREERIEQIVPSPPLRLNAGACADDV